MHTQTWLKSLRINLDYFALNKLTAHSSTQTKINNERGRLLGELNYRACLCLPEREIFINCSLRQSGGALVWLPAARGMPPPAMQATSSACARLQRWQAPKTRARPLSEIKWIGFPLFTLSKVEPITLIPRQIFTKRGNINFNNNFKFKWMQPAISSNLKAMAISLMCFRFSFLIKESNPRQISLSYIKLHAPAAIKQELNLAAVPIREIRAATRRKCSNYLVVALIISEVGSSRVFFSASAR